MSAAGQLNRSASAAIMDAVSRSAVLLGSSPRVAMVVVLALSGSSVSCNANLETTCVTGNNCADYVPPKGVPDVGECFDGCDTASVSGNTGEYPCAVDAIVDVCRNCHIDGGSAPFSLDTYADSQELYGSEARWARIVPNVTSDFMPLGGPALDADQKKDLLDDWACKCAPPREADETCE